MHQFSFSTTCCLSPIVLSVPGVQPYVASVQSDITGIQSHVSGVQPDVSGILAHVAGVQPDFAGLLANRWRRGRQPQVLVSALLCHTTFLLHISPPIVFA